MTVLQAAAVFTLWVSRRFDTGDIAKAVNCSEADVCRVLDAIRNRQRGPDLHLAISNGRTPT